MQLAHRSARGAAALLVAVVSLSACSSEKPVSIEDIIKDHVPSPAMTPSAPVGDAIGDPNACAHFDGPLLDIPSRGSAEPKLRVPKATGWNRSTKLDSEIVRFVLVNTDLAANQFAPNIVVTLEDAPKADVQTIFSQQHANLVKLAGAKDLTSEPATVCGLPAETIKFTADPTGPGAHSRVLTVLSVPTIVGGHQYLVTATVQTTDPDSPTYQHDAKALLDGFQVLPPELGAP
ncbi:LpqN/LpqT family lipoprotein [Mycobacterium sp. DL440]|uniref:LpqN/LpqT family lipoprotein n=1 Tax=Mycobacterium sp. DL440 TaxID=2675523 RepID=UPI001422CA38|nr:LpqN/LpqT family lipoprotein [Mycobacterium sp. DL440]